MCSVTAEPQDLRELVSPSAYGPSPLDDALSSGVPRLQHGCSAPPVSSLPDDLFYAAAFQEEVAGSSLSRNDVEGSRQTSFMVMLPDGGVHIYDKPAACTVADLLSDFPGRILSSANSASCRLPRGTRLQPDGVYYLLPAPVTGSGQMLAHQKATEEYSSSRGSGGGSERRNKSKSEGAHFPAFGGEPCFGYAPGSPEKSESDVEEDNHPSRESSKGPCFGYAPGSHGKMGTSNEGDDVSPPSKGPSCLSSSLSALLLPAQQADSDKEEIACWRERQEASTAFALEQYRRSSSQREQAAAAAALAAAVRASRGPALTHSRPPLASPSPRLDPRYTSRTLHGIATRDASLAGVGWNSNISRPSCTLPGVSSRPGYTAGGPHVGLADAVSALDDALERRQPLHCNGLSRSDGDPAAQPGPIPRSVTASSALDGRRQREQRPANVGGEEKTLLGILSRYHSRISRSSAASLVPSPSARTLIPRSKTAAEAGSRPHRSEARAPPTSFFSRPHPVPPAEGRAASGCAGREPRGSGMFRGLFRRASGLSEEDAPPLRQAMSARRDERGWQQPVGSAHRVQVPLSCTQNSELTELVFENPPPLWRSISARRDGGRQDAAAREGAWEAVKHSDPHDVFE